LQDLSAPSYIYSLLTDSRIVGDTVSTLSSSPTLTAPILPETAPHLGDDYCSIRAGELMSLPAHSLHGLQRSLIPQEAGIYGFFRITDDCPCYFGESTNLRQRISQNHIHGDFGQSGVKRMLRKTIQQMEEESNVDYLRRLSDMLKSEYQVRFLKVNLGRKEWEEYLNRTALGQYPQERKV
jgi:hypothetical protein